MQFLNHDFFEFDGFGVESVFQRRVYGFRIFLNILCSPVLGRHSDRMATGRPSISTAN